MKLLVLLTFSSGFAFAQVQSGRIVGTVYDPSHAAVPKATVIVANTATNISRRVLTDAGGDYVVTPLDPGTYSVSATAPGFQTTVRGGIELTVGLAARVDLELRLGETTTEVRVTTEAPLLTTESGTLGQVDQQHGRLSTSRSMAAAYRTGAPDPWRHTAAAHRQHATRAPGERERQRHQRRRRLANHLPARWRRCHRAASGRHLDPDFSRRAAGIQRTAKRIFGRVRARRRIVQRHHQVRLRTSCSAMSSSSCATTSSTPATSSRPPGRS